MLEGLCYNRPFAFLSKYSIEFEVFDFLGQTER